MPERYPFAPLAAAMGLTEHAAAVALGLSGSTQQDYRRRGVTEQVADRLAVRAGLVPYEVWPSMLDDAVDAAEQAEEERRERRRRQRRESYYRHREAINARRRAQRAANPERARAVDRSYYSWQQRRAKYLKNRDHYLERQREYDRRRAAERRSSQGDRGGVAA